MPIIKYRFRSGTIYQFNIVHVTGTLLGRGWVFHNEYGPDKPILISPDGTQMEEGWYTLQMDSEHLGISADRIQ